MAETPQTNMTDENLDRLTQFLTDELADPALVDQIPGGAHIFHGAFNDMQLTQANIKLATEILMEMVLGISEDAPLVMVFEHKPGQKTVIDLSTEARKRKAQDLLKAFQDQNQQEVVTEINELLAA